MKKRNLALLAALLVGSSYSNGFTPGSSQKVSAAATATEITFEAPVDYPFADGTFSKIEDVTVNEAIETMMLPLFEYSETYSLAGWRSSADGQLYQPYELLRKGFYAGDSTTFTAETAPQGAANTTDLYEDRSTINDRMPSIGSLNLSSGNVYTYPDPDPNSGDQYATYTADANGFRQALYDMYDADQKDQDYVLYVGGTVTSLGTIGNKEETATGPADITFYALSDRLSSLTITGTSEDLVNNQPATSATGLGSLALPDTVHFGTDIELRNLSYTGTTMAMNGNALYLGGGAFTTTVKTIYGGSSDGSDVMKKTKRQANIFIASTGATAGNLWNVYGGSNDGTYTGDSNVAIVATNKTYFTEVIGGNNSGTFDGNTNLFIYDARSITNIYGGTELGTVTGNANTMVRTMNSDFRFTNYRGGATTGTINGSVTNFVAGYGGIEGAYWYGGSTSGNIGTAGNNDFIQTIYDSSLFSQGNPRFAGGNQTRGIINTDITNTIRAAKSLGSGTIWAVNGSTTAEAVGLTSISAANMDSAVDAQARRQIAQNGINGNTPAAMQTIGKLDTHILGGIVANNANGEGSFTHATGVDGYFEGDAIVTLGILNSNDKEAGGYNFCTSAGASVLTELHYHASKVKDGPLVNRTQNYIWDIFGGTGGGGGLAWGGYVYGNTSTVINNALARWTYGGGYSGVIDGDTSHTLNGGLVDTLEGGGYTTRRIFGNTTAKMYNGEVNFFFSGGGWDDDKIVGNVNAYCEGGYINAPIGGTYGNSTGHTITGDAYTEVTGGNFSGMNNPSHGDYQGFSGGATRFGTIQGNVTLTLDLRSAKDFVLPAGTNITGGNPNSGAGRVGNEDSDLITLNVYTSPGSDVLNGANIYGDGGTAARTNSGNIHINIDAPGSSIGHFYATEYSNRLGSETVASRRLLRNVDIHIQNAGSIAGLSGGNETDNIDNVMYNNSKAVDKYVDIIVGDDTINPDDQVITDDPIDFTDLGLVNFTSLTIQNGASVLANGGDIENGRNATAATHYNTYNEFGDVLLEDGSGFGIMNASNKISAGKLTVNGKGSIFSPPGKGKFNLSDVEMLGTDPLLTWYRVAGGDALAASTGEYFGGVAAYQVLTINPTINEAATLTPFNFTGIEMDTGKTFIGDGDITTEATGTAAAQNGFGLMIPGSVIDYEVTTPVANGAGDIQHDVSEVKDNNLPLPLEAWGTEQADTTTQKGRLMIPAQSSQPLLPTLTFTPETPDTGSWVKEVDIVSTDINGTYSETIGEQPDSTAPQWQLKEAGNGYSYTIKVTYSNQAEVNAKNMIITEEQAKQLQTIAEVTDMQEAKGRPFMSSSLTNDVLNEIKAGLSGTELSKRYPITYSVKDKIANTTNEAEKEVNLVVVNTDSKVSDSGAFALYAKDATYMLAEANQLRTQAEVDARTLAKVIFADNTVDALADLDPDHVTAIHNVTSAQDLPIEYTATLGSETIEKPVTIHVTGAIAISKCTDYFEFGLKDTSSQTQTHWPTRSEEQVVISDSRGDGRDWELSVTEKTTLTDPVSGNKLTGCLYYRTDSGNERLSDSPTIIYQGNNGSVGGGDFVAEVDATEDWSDSKGICLTVPAAKQVNGAYAGELEWTLTAGP